MVHGRLKCKQSKQSHGAQMVAGHRLEQKCKDRQQLSNRPFNLMEAFQWNKNRRKDNRNHLTMQVL
jgi:hypothetical protein